MFLKLCLFILWCNYYNGVIGQLRKVVVDTKIGKIIGNVGNDFTMFRGIPYGLIDVKDPFGPAKPHPYFKEPYPAFNESVICPQYDKGVIKGSIQCLHLNVYRPNVITPTRTLPVMIFIHGGGFVEGNGALTTYSPIFLIRYGVIIVTVNYRLGPYGNLCLPYTKYSNQGLKDQILALKWVKNNIASFGGETDNITLFGHSAGSISADFLLLFTNEDLFNKIILQSGQAVSPLPNQATDMATFIKDVGMDDENTDYDSFIQTISTIDTNTLINITKLYTFRPCIDEELVTKIPYMTKSRNIKIMVGGTSKETRFLYHTADKTFYDNFNFSTELNLGFSVSKMADDSAITVMKHFYYDLDNLKDNIIDFLSDFEFNYPTERSVNYYVQNNFTVYRYLFTYEGGRNYMKVRENIKDAGSTHGDELGYLFDIRNLFGNITKEDQVIIDRMTVLWTNFAKYGNPTPTISDLVPVNWTPVTAGTKPYLRIDNDLAISYGPMAKHMAFWDLYYSKYGMYSKGISFGEKWERLGENNGISLDISKFLLLLCCFLVWQ